MAGCRLQLERPVSIAPLIVLRVAFGLMMFASAVRFMARGWIDEFYVVPQVQFTYLGFGWIRPLSPIGMWLVFILLAILGLCITFGLLYRLSIISFFLLFTYVELIDKTFYLNHYYFVSVLAFWLIWLPLNGRFSLDNKLNIAPVQTAVPAWMIIFVRVQLGIVYFFAGLAKLNPDWLFRAMPLAIWLPARASTPLIGWLFDYQWVAFAMSYAGLLFDLTIPFWLSWRKSRGLAYTAVVIFHLLTGFLFNIGVFPWIMIGVTLVYFEWPQLAPDELTLPKVSRFRNGRFVLLTLFLLYQLLMPLRHWLYPGNVLWNEEGFRFSWRVMLVEKAGHVTFFVRDPETGQESTVFPSDYLTLQQEKQMSFQPDMILQFAHFLAEQYEKPVEVRAEAYVSWNGRSSQLLINPDTDLAAQPYDLWAKGWVLPNRN